jgi:hypothetical protein
MSAFVSMSQNGSLTFNTCIYRCPMSIHEFRKIAFLMTREKNRLNILFTYTQNVKLSMMAEKSYSYNLLRIYGVKMYLVSMILIHNDNSYGIMIPEI